MGGMNSEPSTKDDGDGDGDEQSRGAEDDAPCGGGSSARPARRCGSWAAADGVLFFGPDRADEQRVDAAPEPAGWKVGAADAREKQAQRGVERDGQQGGNYHGHGLGIGQWLEHAAFLGLRA